MLSPKTLLPWLLGGAVGLGGILQGLHWRAVGGAADVAGLKEQLRIAVDENTMLKRENDQLRTRSADGGELTIPKELIERVTREYELEFKSPPVVRVISSEELRDRVNASWESRFGPSGIDDRQEAWRLIGWLGAEDDLLGQITAVRSVGARGWFDDMSGEVWVTGRFDLNSVPDQGALVRLLVRLLLHQHFPPPGTYPGDEAARAREAIHQGAASGAEARFMAANARAIGFMSVKENPEVKQLFASLPPFVRAITAFPTMEGRGLADTEFVKGNAAFRDLLSRPPLTTRGVMMPDSGRLAPPVLEMPAGKEESFLAESAGQLGLRVWLSLSGADDASAAAVSAHWKNDRYLLVPDGESSLAVMWDIVLDSNEAAGLVESAALRMAARLAGATDPPSAGARIKSADGRYLQVVRVAPDRVRFIHAATESFALSNH